MNLENIENRYETLVAGEIDRMVEEQPGTLDPSELEDIACLALSRLPARYVRSAIDLLSHESDQDRGTLFTEVKQAVQEAIATNRRQRRREE